MDILENPFCTLGATLRDNRRHIMMLEEEKSLLEDEQVVSSASSVLTNPRKRLAAEVAWLPSLGPKSANELISFLQTMPEEVLHVEGLPYLARANLLAGGLKLVSQRIGRSDLREWILRIAEAYDGINVDDTLMQINEDRNVSGFPQVTDAHAVEAEINSRRQYFKQVIRDALDQLESADLVGLMTEAVEHSTDMGDTAAPILIDELVDAYEVEAQEFLDNEEENISALLVRIRSLADNPTADTSLASAVDELVKVVRNWDTVAQPIQVSAMSRGLGHDASTRVALEIRDIAVDLFNKHDRLEISQKITALIQESFAEVAEVADRTKEDAVTLNEIADQRRLGEFLDPISDLCTAAVETSKTHPKLANTEAQKITSAASRLIDELRNAGANESILNRGRDEIALTLMQCAIAYGNETSDWKECVKILESAMNLCGSEKARQIIRENLSTANQNKTLFGDLTPVATAPTLSTVNGFGFTLYGCTDVDPATGSHIATYYFTALFVPVFPISRYRVIQNGKSYRFIGKAPLRPIDKIHLGLSACLSVFLFFWAQ